MATGGWVADLHKKEHKNWVMVGCALNITKNGITAKIQTEMETWYQSLISNPPLQTLPSCTCAPRAPKCPSCLTWELELTRHHTSKRPKICWGNSDKRQWGSPTGAWEVAKVFMPTLGSRKTDVVDANTTDIGGLLNLLEWCPFIKPPVSGKSLSSARDECRNHWAHAPKQELQDADVLTIFGHLNSLLSDPVFNADKAAQNASRELQDLFHQGLVNVRDSEVAALHLLRKSLVADLTKFQDDLADVQDKVDQLDVETTKVNRTVKKDLSELKDKSDTNTEEIGRLLTKVDEVDRAAARDISEIKQQSNVNRDGIDKIETRLIEAEANLSRGISTVLRAVDDFNSELNERGDLRDAFDLIRDEVEPLRNGIQNTVTELNVAKSQMANLESNFGSMKHEVQEVKCDVKEIANEVASNRNTICGLQRDVMDVKEEVETMKGNASQTVVDDGDILCTAPRSLPEFTGRKLALEWLESSLVVDSGGTSLCTKAVCGLGGCGKTSLAVEFAWTCKNHFPGGVFWINGESDENIQKSVVVNIPASTTEKIDDTLNKYLAWLSKKKHPWLLVVDNADELQDSDCPTGIKKICRGAWQRNGNASKHGHILLTTRKNAKDTRSVLKLSSDDCLELQCFSEEEGALFLMRRTGFDGESLDPDAILLAKELGALPLALEQAAAYISVSPIPLSFKDYLQEFQAVKIRLLKQHTATPLSVEAQHRLSVHTTWEMNFEFVKKQSPAAATMMRIAAFLESENIPIEVINPGLPELDQEELRNCVLSKIDIATILKVMSSYSLFSVHHQTKAFGVHKLVQEVVRDSLTSSERIEALVAATRVLHFAFKKISKSEKSAKCSIAGTLSEMTNEDANLIFALLLSFRKLKSHMEEEMKLPREAYNHDLFNENTSELFSFVYCLIRNNISLLRSSKELSDFGLKVYFIVHGDANPNEILSKMVNTGKSKRNCSTPEDYKEAKQLSENTVQKMAEFEEAGAVIDAEVKYQVLRFRASFYATEVQWEKNYRALLKLEDLPLSEATYVNLQMNIGNAENYVSACNFQTTLKRYNKALTIARKIYTWDHPELLRLLQHITTLFANENKLQEAKQYAEEMLKICKNIPPTSDWYIKGMESALSVLSNFDPRGSENTLLDILKERWPNLYSCVKDDYMDNCASIVDDGSDDPACLVLRGVLKCFWVIFKGGARIPTAKLHFYRRIGEMLLAIQKKFYGDIHPGMVGAYGYLATLHTLLGTDVQKVLGFQKMAVKCTVEVSDKIYQSPPCDYRVYNAREFKDLGNRYFKSGDYSSALDAYNKALTVSPNDGKLLTNRAAAYVKLSEQHEQSHVGEQRKLLKCALEDSQNAINTDPSWVKGYYWKVVCLADLGERGPSLAAAALAGHLFPSQCKQIPAVVQHFGSYHAKVVNSMQELLNATETMDNNVVILVKEGRYELPKALKVPTNAVLVGLGDVQISCTKGVPLQKDKTVYIENIKLFPTMESTTDLKAQAKECLNRGQWDLALSLYSKALAQCPNDAQLLTARATTYLKSAEKKIDIPSERQSLLELSLKDSEAAIIADSSWLPGYCMKARSLAELNRKQQALAATAVLKHLSSGRDISGVSQRYGGVRVHTVEDSDELCCVLQNIEEQLEGMNQVVLLKQGEYNLEKSVEITQPIVMVGQGKVTVSCKTGRPFNFTQEHFVENVELCGDYDDQRESQDCGNSIDTQPEVTSLPGSSGEELTNLSSECKVD